MIIASLKRISLLASVLIRMSRPAQLLAIILVYLFGSIVAWVHNVNIDLSIFFFGLVVVLPISASIHYANEYADYETDSLTRRTPFSGGSGALQDSGLPHGIALGAAWFALLIGFFLGLMGLYLGLLNPIALVILIWGTFWGWMYSLRPLALAWRGWGELDNAMLGGVTLPVYGFSVQAGSFNPWLVLTFIPFGMLVFINLLATTWADREADAKVGKFTLATRWSAKRLRLLYLVVAVGVFVYLLLFRRFLFPPLVVFSSFLVIPVLVWGISAYTRQHSPFPTVAAMAVFLLNQVAAWGILLLKGYL